MSHPLDGSKFKIVWAHQHLGTLTERVARYLHTKPYTFPTEQRGNEVLVPNQPSITVQPPPELGAIIGDCLCSLMASLDYIVWELASRYVGRPLVPPPAKKGDAPSFPLFTDQARYKSNLPKLTRYKIPTDALAEIERVQPYNAGYDPLARLYLLVNQDKHRLPLLTIGQADSHSMRIRYRGRDAFTVIGKGGPSIVFQTDTPGAPPYDPSQMQVDGQVIPFVAFADLTMPREPVERTLQEIVECVANIIPRFEGFF